MDQNIRVASNGGGEVGVMAHCEGVVTPLLGEAAVKGGSSCASDGGAFVAHGLVPWRHRVGVGGGTGCG